ncbi:site-specific recombinase domain protein [Bordetella holmesii H620]|nr:site-specific recombinase domain protein [Bordetella holmesii H620]
MVADNDPLSLFCDTGVASQPGFWGEMVERVQARYLPLPPNRSDMFAIFSLVFTSEDDADWLRAIDEDTLERLRDLLQVPDSRRDPALGMDADRLPGFEQALVNSSSARFAPPV